MKKSIPVLMYHYISTWENPISVHPDVFEEHLKALSDMGFRGIGLDEALRFFRDGETLPGKPALITFDDGFLDNYVYAWPLLEKYGHKGIIFAVTDKLENGSPRRTIKDVWDGTIGRSELPRVDSPYVKGALGYEERADHFINWEEARLMEKSGVISVEAHSRTHRSVFVSPEYSGFHGPGKRTRTFNQVDAETPFGLPKFKLGPSLSSRAWLPSQELYELVSWEMPDTPEKCDEYFKNPEKVARLEKILRGMPREKWGRFETDEEKRERMFRELAPCARALRENLGRVPKAMCWPWGAYDETALSIAKEVGFEIFFATTMGPNTPGCAEHIHRFKAKNKPASWMKQRLFIYSRPWLAWLYAKIRL